MTSGPVLEIWISYSVKCLFTWCTFVPLVAVYISVSCVPNSRHCFFSFQELEDEKHRGFLITEQAVHPCVQDVVSKMWYIKMIACSWLYYYDQFNFVFYFMYRLYTLPYSNCLETAFSIKKIWNTIKQ